MNRVIIAITGATGAIYGIRLLQVLRELDHHETHLVISSAGALNIQHELGIKRSQVYALADVTYDDNDLGAAIASGAFATLGMIIAPCSMKTLSAVAHGYSSNLIARAADVTLKERRKLVVVPRETPLNLIHIRNMASLTEAGGIIFPPVPAFYGHAKSFDQIIDETTGRILDVFGIPTTGLYEPWTGIRDVNLK